MCLFVQVYSNYGRIVCEIFSAKKWCDFEHRVRVRSRSLEIAPFDRSHMSSYSPFIVTMAVSLAISEIFQTWTWVGSTHGLGWVGLGWVGINGLNCNDSTHVYIVAIVNKSVTA